MTLTQKNARIEQHVEKAFGIVNEIQKTHAFIEALDKSDEIETFAEKYKYFLRQECRLSEFEKCTDLYSGEAFIFVDGVAM